MNGIAQGEIYLVHDASGKHRPFVVVSRSELNRERYCLAVPFTTGRLLRQSDIVRPIKRIGRVSPNKLEDLLDALGYVIGADCKPE